MKRAILVAVAFAEMIVVTRQANAQGESGGKVWLSPFASSLVETCKQGWLTRGRTRESSKPYWYCIGFLYSIIGRMDLDGRICLGLTGNMDRAIEASATLLSAAGPKLPLASITRYPLGHRLDLPGLSRGGMSEGRPKPAILWRDQATTNQIRLSMQAALR